MGTQSFIMMYQAGEGWQYGKRKQSALSNEEFNKQTPLSIMNRQRQELINALPSIKDSMNAMTPLISTIVEQYGDFVSEAIKAAPKAVQNATDFQLPFIANADDGGQGTQKQFQDNNPNTWQGLIAALTTLALSIAQGGGGRVIRSGPGPNPETEEERIRNDLLIQGQTKESNQERNKRLREQNRFGNRVPERLPVPVIGKDVTPKTLLQKTHGAQINEFEFTIATLLQRVQQGKRALQDAVGGSAVKLATTKLKRHQRTLMNFITVKRNIAWLKPAANTHWRNQIWK